MPEGLYRALAEDAEAVDRGQASIAGSVGRLAQAGLLAQAGQRPSQDWAFEHLFHLGGVSLPAARLFEGHLDALGLVQRCGSFSALRLAREAATGGKLLGVWGADAPDAPAGAMQVSGGRMRLTGAKLFASGLGCVSLAVVTVRDRQCGVRLVLVDAADPARHDAGAWDMDAMVGSASGRFRLDAMVIDPSCQLGEPGALFAEPHFHGGLWRICAAQAGALNAMAGLLAQHLAARAQLGDPLQRQRAAQVALASASARLWAERARDAVRPGAAPGAIETVLFAREAVEQAAIDGMELCERAVGTALHQRGSAMGRLMRDLRLYLRQAALDAKLDHALALWLGRRDTPGCDEPNQGIREQPGNPAVGI